MTTLGTIIISGLCVGAGYMMNALRNHDEKEGLKATINGQDRVIKELSDKERH